MAELGANRAEVRKRHEQITKENGPYAANHAMRAFRSAYNHALRVDAQLPSNPIIAVTFNKEERRDAVITPEDLPDWWRAIHKLPNSIRRDFHLFLLFTGMRRRAAAAGQWEHVDWGIGERLMCQTRRVAKSAPLNCR